MMKRTIFAAVLLLLVAGACIMTIQVERRNTTALIEQLDAIEEVFNIGDRAECLEMTEAFADDFVARTKHFTFFMRHSDLTKIEETAVALPVILRTDGNAHFPAELVKCRNQLEKLADLEMPTWDNIL